MLFNEYAEIKLESYRKLNWFITDIDIQEDKYSFVTKDSDQVIRQHIFSKDGIFVSILDAFPAVEPEVADKQVEQEPIKKTRKTKKAAPNE